MCLKCGKSKNKKFILLLSLFILIRKIILLLLKKFCKFEGTLITAWLMFAAELLIGFFNIIVEYKKLLNVGIKNFLSIPINPNKPETRHSKLTKVLLFLLCAILDFFYFFFIYYYATKRFNNIGFLFDIRLSSFLVIFGSIISIIIFSQKFGCCQILSIFFILISLIGTIGVEYKFIEIENKFELIKLLIFLIGSQIFSATQYCIEKYLMEYDNSTPFQILFYEGIFGNIIMVIIYFININNKFIDKAIIENTITLIILIIGFILYFFSCIFVNIYKLTVINFSYPTNVATSESITIIPLFLINYFIINYFFDDAQIDKIKDMNFNTKLIYLGINCSIIIIIIICNIFFNEVIMCKCKCCNNKNNRKSIRISEDLNLGLNGLDGSFTTEGEESF